MSENRPAAEIAADIQATREQLISNLDQLVERTQPERLAADQLARVKDFYLDEFGGIRVDRAAKTAGIFFGLLLVRKLFK
jgi:hypothetical protein